MTGQTEDLRGALLWHIWHGAATANDLETINAEYGVNVYAATLQLITLRDAGLIAFVDPPLPGQPVVGPELDAEDAARREYARLTGARSCRVCGCSAAWSCPEGCCWAGEDLCDVCQDAEAGAP